MTLEAREKTIKALLQDDDALSREEAESLYEKVDCQAPQLARQLVWQGPDAQTEIFAKGHMAGLYVIQPEARPGCRFWLTTVGKFFHSIDGAKHAAQAHEEERIRAAISPAVLRQLDGRPSAAEPALATFALRCAAQGIALPVRESEGEEGIGEIEDAAGTNILQIDPMGMLDDAKVSAMAALIVEAINAMGNAGEGQTHA